MSPMPLDPSSSWPVSTPIEVVHLGNVQDATTCGRISNGSLDLSEESELMMMIVMMIVMMSMMMMTVMSMMMMTLVGELVTLASFMAASSGPVI